MLIQGRNNRYVHATPLLYPMVKMKSLELSKDRVYAFINEESGESEGPAEMRSGD